MFKKILVLGFLSLFVLPVLAADYVTPVSTVTDPIRDFANFVAHFDYITRFIVLALTLFLAYVAYTAYSKNKSEKLFLVSLAFGLFFLKWLLKVLDIFFSPGTFFSQTYENVFELVILGALFYALLKR